jgi:signal transduction histidine kinase
MAALNASAAATDLELTATLCHEMTQPLCFLLTNLGAARIGLSHLAAGRMEPRLSQLERWLDGAYACADQLGHVLTDIRSRLTQEPDTQVPIQLEGLLDRTIGMIERDAHDRARIVRDLDRTPRVLGSTTRLQQVMLNLLSNALRSIPPGTPEQNHIVVRLRLEEEVNAVTIEIRDTGCGIDDEDRVREPKLLKGGGMGIGLAISRRIVAAHGGNLSLSQNRPHGTVARIELPIKS